MNDKSDNGEKTEAPTEHRLKKSKEEGQVPRFTTLSMLTGLLGGILGLGLCWIAVSGSVKTGFSKALQVTQRSGWRDMDIKAYLLENLLSTGKVMLPFFSTILITGLLGAYCVSGFSLSWHRVRLNLNRCNPLKGWQQWMGLDTWVNFSGACLKCLSVVLIFLGLIKMQYLSVLDFGKFEAKIGTRQLMHWCFMATFYLISPLIVWTLLEVAYQKWSFFKKLKMSKQDMKEEIKHEEGRSEIKMKIKQAFHQRLSDTTAESMKKAVVLITDGHERSIVLRYAENKSMAPLVLEKGLKYRTKQLKKMACQYGVPQVTASLLAQQLFAEGKKGCLIPVSLYEAVAKLLANIKSLTLDQTGSQ